MKNKDTGIFNYSIERVYTDLGQVKTNLDFFVFDSINVNGSVMQGRPIRSDHFTIFLLNHGEAQIKLNLIEYTLYTNSVFIIPPQVVHEFLSKTADARIVGLGFSTHFIGSSGLPKKYVDSFSFLAAQNNPHLELQPAEAEILYTLMLLLQKKNLNSHQNPFVEEILSAGFTMYMLELAAVYLRYKPAEKVTLTRKADLLMCFIKLLSIHFKEERSVQFYAESLFITPKHLTKTIKEITGHTCGELIDEMVITEAKILLNNRNLSIGNVADELHFSDQFFFSKFFKQHTGLSPSEYKARP